MPSPETGQPELVAAARQAILHLIDAVRHEAECRASPRTVRDIVQTRPTSRRCVLGAVMSTVYVQKGAIRNQRSACSGGKCAHCVDHWLVTVMLRALRLWGFPDLIYRVEFTEAAWRNKRAEVTRFRRTHPLFLSVRNGDRRIAFSPEPIDGGERVDPSAVLDALLDSPYSGQHRFAFAQSEAKRERDQEIADEDTSTEKPEARISTRVPRDYTLEGLANRYSVAVGRALDWQTEHGKRGAPFSAADTTEGLSENEVVSAAETCQELKTEWLQERDLDLQVRRLVARWPSGLPSGVADDATLCPA